MPEGPSIVILKEEIDQFIGKKVLRASGSTTKVDTDTLVNKTLVDIKTWGKHLLLCFPKFTVRIHLLLFGSYRVNEERESKPRLHLEFANGFLNFYACSVILITEDLDTIYDWTADVMSDAWTKAGARKKLKAQPDMLACDALLNQQIFSGSGNIIKNEVLFRTRIHPESRVGALPKKKLTELIEETRKYSFEFLEWKKAYVLKKHWKMHTKKVCPRCNIPAIKKILGKTKRRTFYCENCQVLYT